MSIRRIVNSLRPCLVFTLFSMVFLSSQVYAFDFESSPNFWGGSDEDTILVEDEVINKISYSRAIKSACKNFLDIDIDKFFSGGKNKRSAVIRHFNDLSERSHYRLQLDQEEVTFKFTLNL